MAPRWRSIITRLAGVATITAGVALAVGPPAGAAAVEDADALRAAISSLNGTGPAAEIELKPGTTYSLPGSAGCKDEDGNASGDLDILRSQPLKIFTPDGQPPAIIEMTCDAGGNPQRVIQVLAGAQGQPAGKLTLRNVVIRNGHAPDSTASRSWGGGVLASGEVVVEHSRFETNTAGDGPDGTAAHPDGHPAGYGGAIAVSGKLTVDHSTFVGNRAGNGGDGLSRDELDCAGESGGDGGRGGDGGALIGIAGITIIDSTFDDNHAGSGGNGGHGGCATPNAVGGGNGGDGGQAGSGGAAICGVFFGGDRPLHCTASMTVRGSTMVGNTTGDGGDGGNGGNGVLNGNGGAGGAGGTFEANGFGGAITFIGDPRGPTTLLVENTTLDANSTGNGGDGGDAGDGGPGGFPGGAETDAVAPAAVTPLQPGNGGHGGHGGQGGIGGAIAAGFVTESDLQVAKLVHVTATDNGAGGLGGAGGEAGKAGAPIPVEPAADAVAAAAFDGEAGEDGDDMGGSLLFFNAWTSVASVVGTSAGDGPDCWEPAASGADSVSTDDTCEFGDATTVQAFATFGLGALGDNGGPTRTRLPAADSGLVDKVTEVPLAVDQRGVPRPQSAKSDIGAVEIQRIDLAVTKTASATSVVAGTEVTFTIKAENTGTSSPAPGVTVDDPKCSGVSTASGDTNGNATLDPGETFSYTCKATLTEVGTFTNTATVTVTDAVGAKITRSGSVDVTVTGTGAGLAVTGPPDLVPALLWALCLIATGTLLVVLARRRGVQVRVITRPRTPAV